MVSFDVSLLEILAIMEQELQWKTWQVCLMGLIKEEKINNLTGYSSEIHSMLYGS